jgi:hypothetical protein
MKCSLVFPSSKELDEGDCSAFIVSMNKIYDSGKEKQFKEK